MQTLRYRLVVIGSALSWLLLGLHVPALHEMTHDGHAISPLVVSLTALFAVAALAGLWSLLRDPGRRPSA